MESNKREKSTRRAAELPVWVERDDIHQAPRRRVFEIRRNILRKLLSRIEKSKSSLDAPLSISEH